MTPPRRLPELSLDDSTPELNGAIGATAETFAGRMQRRLKEQELRDQQVKQAVQGRHALMLQAMTTIRKALGSSARINLGERFHFSLDVSDWEGWPRVELNLIDGCDPQRVSHALIITANDRKHLGTVQIGMKSGEVLARLHLSQPREIEKLPLLLKKSVRHFLDLVGAYVLNPPAPEEMLETQSQSLGATDFDVLDRKLQNENLFAEDDVIQSGNTVDSLSDVNPLDDTVLPLK